MRTLHHRFSHQIRTPCSSVNIPLSLSILVHILFSYLMPINLLVETEASSSVTPLAAYVISPKKQRSVLGLLDASKYNVVSGQEQQHLALIGGGHAHVQVIKALASRPSHLHVTLIDAQTSATYSGMVPGCIAGLYTPDQTQLHLPPLAEWAGQMKFVHGRVMDLDLERKLLYVEQLDQPIAFDVVSIDIGSTSRGLESCPGAYEYAIPTRPISKLIHRLDSALSNHKQQRNPDHTVKLVVIGGGAAGIELAMSVTSRWRRELEDSMNIECNLLDAGDRLLPMENDNARKTLQSMLDEKHIVVRHECHVSSITDDAVHLESGESVPYTHCIWATGAGAHPLAQHLQSVRGLDCDKYGWIKVNASLQSVSHPFVFAAGDCATITGLANGSPPKAGVYAVRAGPILIQNLTRYLDSLRVKSDQPDLSEDDNEANNNAVETELLKYTPQDDFLKLLVCGDEIALGFRFGLAMHGKWVFDLKDNIDQSFMKLFDVSDLPKSDSKSIGSYDTRQYDADDELKSLILPGPKVASALLLRNDDDVDFQINKLVLRQMGQDDNFREAVLHNIDLENGTLTV